MLRVFKSFFDQGKNDGSKFQEKEEEGKQKENFELDELSPKNNNQPGSPLKYEFINYKVTSHDTLQGISLLFDLGARTIMNDNGLSSDHVYTGQTLKIRRKIEERLNGAQNINGSPSKKADFDIPQEDAIGFPQITRDPLARQFQTISDLKIKKDNHFLFEQWNVQFCTNVALVYGKLTLSKYTLSFQSSEIEWFINEPYEGFNENTCKAPQFLRQFEAYIDIADIADSLVIKLPGLNFAENEEMDYMLQLLLTGIGDKSYGPYFDEIFYQKRQKSEPYACLYFKIYEPDQSNEDKDAIIDDLRQKLAEARKQYNREKNTYSTSKIPQNEFLYEKFDTDDGKILKGMLQKEKERDIARIKKEAKDLSTTKKGSGGYKDKRTVSSPQPSSQNNLEEQKELEHSKSEQQNPEPQKKKLIRAKLTSVSKILTLNQFNEIMTRVPELYQLLEWKMVYSNLNDGTSFENLLRKSRKATPFLMLIKDDYGTCFGVYGNEALKYSSDYYGGGETFLFTFKDGKFQHFYWSKKNDYFMFVSEEGMTFGSAPHYALWINNELFSGRSYASETFNNVQLSKYPEFEVLRVEVWTIIDPFSRN